MLQIKSQLCNLAIYHLQVSIWSSLVVTNFSAMARCSAIFSIGLCLALAFVCCSAQDTNCAATKDAHCISCKTTTARRATQGKVVCTACMPGYKLNTRANGGVGLCGKCYFHLSTQMLFGKDPVRCMLPVVGCQHIMHLTSCICNGQTCLTAMATTLSTCHDFTEAGTFRALCMFASHSNQLLGCLPHARSPCCLLAECLGGYAPTSVTTAARITTISECVKCPEGSIANGGRASCQACPINAVTNTNQTACCKSMLDWESLWQLTD